MTTTKLTPEQKKANKLGNAIEKILGKDTQFIIISYSESKDMQNGKLESLSNIQDKIQRIGMLELAKNDSINGN